MGPAALALELTGGHPPLLIDLRPAEAFAAGHLPGAVHLGKGILERDIEKLIKFLSRKSD